MYAVPIGNKNKCSSNCHFLLIQLFLTKPFSFFLFSFSFFLSYLHSCFGFHCYSLLVLIYESPDLSQRVLVVWSLARGKVDLKPIRRHKKPSGIFSFFWLQCRGCISCLLKKLIKSEWAQVRLKLFLRHIHLFDGLLSLVWCCYDVLIDQQK